MYWKIGFYFSFFLIATSFITVVANILLLLVLYKDPLKSFRTPVNNFVISLALVDLLAAVTCQPFSAACFLMVHYKNPSTEICLYYLEEYFSAVTRVHMEDLSFSDIFTNCGAIDYCCIAFETC